ncbi:hypothetical protein EUX98_g3398 [Antrodiella citrinella]|uniref:AA9 family lytic polysaccharide monooxygenase n=1 Tax=Antrodiella citrinella TaxID=2447956 RepID=A0A4S4MWM7_9APHY|nr:hypothetical protein EUX98_g3398 [Antrodiella citrinella]
MFSTTTTLTAVAFGALQASKVAAHGGVLSYNINGQTYQGFKAYNTPVGQYLDQYRVTIPASLAPGEYMLRHELLAIHTSDSPQFYPECAQLVLTGSGIAQPSGSYLVKFPGAYSAADPGVTIDVYATPDATNYTIPGPPVWQG